MHRTAATQRTITQSTGGPPLARRIQRTSPGGTASSRALGTMQAEIGFPPITVFGQFAPRKYKQHSD